MEFVGFAGEECEEERERLREILVGLGVMLRPEQIKKKPTTQILEEIEASNENPLKPSQRRQQHARAR